MNLAKKGIITLLNSAITGEKLPISQDFDLEKEFPIITRHHIHALIYEGASNCGIDRTSPVMKKLLNGYLKSLQISERQMKTFNNVFKAFDENEIDYLPLKGCLMKKLYPKPELRTMGDADVLIKVEQYDRISAIMSSNGFREGEEGEKHISWQSESLHLELHKRLFEQKQTSFVRYFEDGWKHAVPESASRYKMDTENTFAFMFSHFANHFAMEGIGLRHILDFWVYLKKYPSINEDRLKSILNELKLWPFYINIRKLIAVWFENEIEDEKTIFLTNMIFESGSWGSMENRILTEAVQDMGKSDDAKMGIVGYIKRCVFPGSERLKKTYPVLNRFPFLMPVMWFVRLITKLFSAASVYKKHKNALNLLKNDDLLKRKTMLRYVGLDINE